MTKTAFRGARGTFETGAEPSPLDADKLKLQTDHNDAKAGEKRREDDNRERLPPRPLQAFEVRVWKLFCEIDEDRSGYLDKQEVAKMSKKLGFALSDHELASAFEKMDRDRKVWPSPTPAHAWCFRGMLPVDTYAHMHTSRSHL